MAARHCLNFERSGVSDTASILANSNSPELLGKEMFTKTVMSVCLLSATDSIAV